MYVYVLMYVLVLFKIYIFLSCEFQSDVPQDTINKVTGLNYLTIFLNYFSHVVETRELNKFLMKSVLAIVQLREE